jgi:uracil-DNA glycosylase
MNWAKFKEFFHESWHSKMQPFIESEECDKMYEFLKREASRGKKIAPISSNVYRAFSLTPLTDIKVVLVGMCPYHTAIHGVPVADGLLMGCSVTEKLQPSLDQFYNALERDAYRGLNLNYYKNPDVSYLAEQGVLMLNAALTTEINKAGSHLELWEPFMKYLFENVLYYSGAPIVFLGKDASRYKQYLAPFSWSFTLSHPASASYKNTDWDSEGVFSQVNKILMDNNGFKINWLDEYPPF